MQMVDFILWSLIIGAILGFVGIIWNYVKGLKDSPRDMWFLFLYKVIEYTAYAAMHMALILWLIGNRLLLTIPFSEKEGLNG